MWEKAEREEKVKMRAQSVCSTAERGQGGDIRNIWKYLSDLRWPQ